MSDETTPFDPFDYIAPTLQQREAIDRFRHCAKSYRSVLEELPASRERSIALTHLEEALMWSNKAAVRG